MPSSCNKSVTSDRLIKPPHLRPGYVDTPANNGICKYTDSNLKVKNEVKKEVKNDSIDNLVESVSKLYIPSTKPNKSYDFGISKYFDHKFKGTLADYKKQLEESTTLYVGNLNRLSTEADVRRVFSQAGNIKSIIMGVEKKTGAPGEFCFVEYETRNEAERCINTLQNIFLHRRKLLIDWDAGFVEGRQYRRRFSRNYQRTNQAISSSNKANQQFNKQQDDPRKNRFTY